MNALTVEGLGKRYRVGTKQVYDLWALKDVSFAGPRLVTMIQYQTPYSFMLPSSAQADLPFRPLLDPSLTRLQRLVLGE